MTPRLPSLENSFLIAVHDNDIFKQEMMESVREALIFEDTMDSFVFRVVNGTLPGRWYDLYIPVNTARNYYLNGYDADAEFNKVMDELFTLYKKVTPLH